MMDKKIFAHNLHFLRRKRSWGPEQTARRLGVKYKTYINWEYPSHSGLPDLSSLVKICDLFSIKDTWSFLNIPFTADNVNLIAGDLPALKNEQEYEMAIARYIEVEDAEKGTLEYHERQQLVFQIEEYEARITVES